MVIRGTGMGAGSAQGGARTKVIDKREGIHDEGGGHSGRGTLL